MKTSTAESAHQDYAHMSQDPLPRERVWSEDETCTQTMNDVIIQVSGNDVM